MMPPELATSPTHLPQEAELVARVAWLIRLRWAAAAAVFIAVPVARHLLSSRLPWVQLCLIGGAILLYNGIFAWRLRLLSGRPDTPIKTFSHFAALQILLDWLALTLVVHYTGGAESPALSFFIFNAIVAGILLPARMAFLLAAFGIVLVVGLTLLEAWSILSHWDIPEIHDPHGAVAQYLLSSLFVFITAILISMYFATSITRQLVRRTRELGELKQHLEDAYQQMRTLNETSRAVNSTLNLSQVLSTIVRQATEVMGVKGSSIRLLDEEQRFLEVSAAYGLSAAYLTKGKVDAQWEEMDRLAAEGKSLAILDATTDPRFQYPVEARREGIRSMLSVPVMLQAQVIGMLRVYCGEVREFTYREIEFLTALASQGAAAIQNARAYRQLQELEDAKSRFVFTVSHELKGPVATIESQFALLQDGYAGELTEQQRNLINRASRRLAALRALVRDLLALGSLKGRLPQHRRAELDLADVARRVAEGFQPQAEARGVTLTLRVPDAPVAFPTAEDDMHRLLGNLLENAVKYTPSGGVVSLTLEADKSRITIMVSDTGIGITPEAMPHIFTEFYRASNAKETDAEGTGLGLSLVRRIVDLYQGEIVADSQLGKGTTFTVVLPRYAGAPTAD